MRRPDPRLPAAPRAAERPAARPPARSARRAHGGRAAAALAAAAVACAEGPKPGARGADSGDPAPRGNSPPSAPEVRILPPRPTAGQPLALELLRPLSDPDGDPAWLEVAWTVDGAPAPAAGAHGVPAGQTARGEVWAAAVRATDGRHASAEVLEVAVIDNEPPACAVALVPEVPRADDALRAEVDAVDGDGDPVGLRFAWARDGAPAAHDGPELPAGALRRGERWSVEVSPTDGLDAGPPCGAAVTVANSPPWIRAVAISPGDPTVDDELVATLLAEDADGDPLELRFTWTVDGAAQPEGGPALPAGRARKGQWVGLSAVADDGAEPSRPAQAAEVQVANSLPAFSGVRIIPEHPGPADALLCVAEGWSDADGDPAGQRLSWTVAGDPGPSDPALDLGPYALSGGEEVVCEVIPDDGDGLGAPVSARVTLGTTP